MPAPVSVNEFLELGYKANLFDKAAIEAYRQRKPSKPALSPTRLVRWQKV